MDVPPSANNLHNLPQACGALNFKEPKNLMRKKKLKLKHSPCSQVDALVM